MFPGKSPSVAVTPIGGAACATLIFRTGGQLRVAVVVKATFIITPDRPMLPVDPDPIVRADEHRDAGPTSALVAASDLVPYRPRADVLLHGHARAPQGRPTPAMALRLMVSRDQAVPIDKRLVARGTPDPSGKPGEPTPFSIMPLVYEVAVGGPRAPANPAGIAEGGGRWANLVDPRKPTRPAGFGPISPRWPARRGLLSVDAAILDAPIPDLPAHFVWAYFNAAPEDQRIDFLRGDEWIGFEGMNSQLPRVQSCLPGVRGKAQVYGLSAGAPAGQPVVLEADTLTIDTDKLRCSVVWRGSFPVSSLAELGALHVFAGVESPEHPLSFPAVYPPAAAPPAARSSQGGSAPRRPEVALDDPQTVDVPGHAVRPATPFAPSASGTSEVSPDLLARVRAAGAMPFGPSAPAPPRRSQDLPAATPFEHGAPLVAPPSAEPGEETMMPMKSPFRRLARSIPADTPRGETLTASTQPIPRDFLRSVLPFEEAAPQPPREHPPKLPEATPFKRGAPLFEAASPGAPLFEAAAPGAPREPFSNVRAEASFDRTVPLPPMDSSDDITGTFAPLPDVRPALPFGPPASLPSREAAPHLPAATPFERAAALERPPQPSVTGEMTMVVDASIPEIAASPPALPRLEVVVPIQIPPPRIEIAAAPPETPAAAAPKSLGVSFLAAMARARKTPTSAVP